MSNKDLLRQLNKLKGVKPEAGWRTQNREFLMKKLEESETDSGFIHIIKLFMTSARSVSQPVLTVFLIAFIVFGSGFASMQVAKNSKPGDSLYIAKIINEKTQFALTFDEGKKAELGLTFAGNRAKELDQVLNSPEDSSKQGKVEKLVSNFKKEINLAKTRIEKINRDEDKLAAGEETAEEADESQENSAVFSANMGKDENGVELSEPADVSGSAETEATAAPIIEPETTDAAVVTTTPDILPATTTAEAAATESESFSNPEQAISEAKELLVKQDYEATLDKLTEADELIEQVSGQVKGQSEAATTSDSIINNDEAGEVLGASEEATSTIDN